MYISIAFSSYPVFSVPFNPPCSFWSFLYASSIFYFLSFISFCFFSSRSFLCYSIFFLMNRYSSFCFYYSVSYFFLSSSGSSPDPLINSAFLSSSSAAYSAANAWVWSLFCKSSNSYNAYKCIFYLSISSFYYSTDFYDFK